MKFEVKVERHYPYAVADVWDGLTTNEGISDWLMDTDNFKPDAGHRFEMTCLNEAGKVDVYRCQVLDLDPLHRMVWSWVMDDKQGDGETEVEFRLSATDTGTTVIMSHRGDLDQATIDRFKSGWQSKLDQLAETLIRRRDAH